MVAKMRESPKGGMKIRGKKERSSAELKLPVGLSEPKQNLHEYTMLLYGERKIGKTSLASQAANPLFFMFEPGGSSMRIRQVKVPRWVDFLEYLTLLERNPGYCDTVIIDTGAVAYDRCMEYICNREGMVHPSDGEFGKGWKLVADEFKRVHEKIFNMGLGFIVTAHSEIKKVQKRSGEAYHKLSVDLSGASFKYYCGIVDIIAYYQYDSDGARVLTIRGDAHVEAGVRMSENFLYTNGEPIKDIPMGTNEKEAYDFLIKAFNNELKAPTAQIKEPVIGKKKLNRKN